MTLSLIMKLLAGLIPLATEFFRWRRRVDDTKRKTAGTDALTEDLDNMDSAIASDDLTEIGRLLGGLDDPRPVTRGI